MIRIARAAFFLAAAFVPILVAADSTSVTHKGWISDADCAGSKMKSGKLGPNGRECVQKCLAKGVKMVFIDETAGALYEIENPEAALGQESHYIEVAGLLNASGKSLHVSSLKILETYKASCQVPKDGARQ
jgi:hypothetical protein